MAPDSILISTVLPAPLWPRMPTTSPGNRLMSTLSTARRPPKALHMPLISTSGVRPCCIGEGKLAPLTSFIATSFLLAAPAVDGIEPDGQDQNGADHDALQRRVDAEQDHAAGQRLH